MRNICAIMLLVALHVTGRSQSYTIEELPALEPSIYAEVRGLDDRGHLLGVTFNPTNYAYGNFTLEDGAWRAVSLTNFEYHVMQVNKIGVVLGNIYQFQSQPNQSRPFLWRDGVVEELHLFTNDLVVGWGINNKGVIVGQYSTAPGPFHVKPFVYCDGAVQTLEIPDATFATADDINEHGEILINAQNPPRYWSLVRSRNGTLQNIGVPLVNQL